MQVAYEEIEYEAVPSKAMLAEEGDPHVRNSEGNAEISPRVDILGDRVEPVTEVGLSLLMWLC